ncbi:hypothetical protein [Bradyrhizobium sp. LB11.1]|uniref:hypothetical protein n=1 Tax=Bradyrhizobium sp. LB11.1 TaxID=3156326 RepID=UPI003397E674
MIWSKEERRPSLLSSFSSRFRGKEMLVKLIAVAIALLLGASCPASAQVAYGAPRDPKSLYDNHGNAIYYGDFLPVTSREKSAQKVYEAFRYYAYVQYCYRSREGYMAVYVNDVELDRARLKTKEIQSDQQAISSDSPLDTEGMWKRATKNISGVLVNRESCQLNLNTLLRFKSSGGSSVRLEKDF